MFCHQIIIVILISAFQFGLISTTLTYEDLKEIDGVCDTLDTCNVRRSSDSLDKYTCHCDSTCSKLRTCCIDSPYRDIKTTGKRPTCRHVNDAYKHNYFMVDACSSSHNTDINMEKLCTEELSEEDNLIPFIPVTSLSTNVTYKNYYCFKCNEDTNNFIYWNVKVNAHSSSDGVKPEDLVLTYDTTSKTWMAPVGENGHSIPVTLLLEVPRMIKTVPKICIPSVISTCSRKYRIWDVRRKCKKYTSFIFIVKKIEKTLYRNPHCALCNFENLENMGCGNPIVRSGDRREKFSFALLLESVSSEGDIPQKCDTKTMWDPHSLKCRRVTCLDPRDIVKDGKCARP